MTFTILKAISAERTAAQNVIRKQPVVNSLDIFANLLPLPTANARVTTRDVPQGKLLGLAE